MEDEQEVMFDERFENLVVAFPVEDVEQSEPAVRLDDSVFKATHWISLVQRRVNIGDHRR